MHAVSDHTAPAAAVEQITTSFAQIVFRLANPAIFLYINYRSVR